MNKDRLTLFNNKIELIELSSEVQKKTILVIGVFHGDEPDGQMLIEKFLKNKPKNLKNRMLFIPCLNPDGKRLNTRTNANGVDLNRNYPTLNWVLSERNEYFGGDSSGSEIETQFVIDVINEYSPDAILSIHAPYKVVNYDGPAIELAAKISELTGYPMQQDIGYPTPGSFGTYCGIEKNIPTITLELPENVEPEYLWDCVKPVFEYLAFSY